MGEATPWVIGGTQVAMLLAVYFRIDHRISSLEQRVARLEGLIEGYLFAGGETRPAA